MRETNTFDILIKVNSFPLSHPHVRILDGSFFHCCFLPLVYMLHILDGGPTLEMDPMDLEVDECSNLVDAPTLEAPPDHHFYHDIELWYNTTHNNFASYTWIDSHYDCLVASCISMSSMIYELVHFLSKFVVIFLDGIFIHNDHTVHYQLHDNTITLSTNYHVHAFDTPSHYDIILHNDKICSFVHHDNYHTFCVHNE